MFSPSDHSLLESGLAALRGAGITPAPDVEIGDVEDALSDDPAPFRAAPLSALAAATDPDGEPLLVGVAPEALAAAICAFYGTTLTEFVVFPDPGSRRAGSARLRIGPWDVIDVSYDLAAAPGNDGVEARVQKLCAP
ncbi:hypothetical protein [Corynebacterium timonense]|uniref:Uncharacterized protein n=1 Tax=Corynebacterium timonense TaxID=441500 RepID=A0A1H1MBP5_9CORY|nr:hypothetical protein [Corynebacterium timonense]SDR83775.1 hypothetical protein SAMN04488539_0481 [Corynebacterium timonense]